MSKSKVRSMLLSVGITPNLRGYKYIIRAVELAKENPTVIENITGNLYPILAKEFDTQPTSIERCIRHSIKTGLCNIDSMTPIMGFKVLPSNKQFLAVVLDNLEFGECKYCPANTHDVNGIYADDDIDIEILGLKKIKINYCPMCGRKLEG